MAVNGVWLGQYIGIMFIHPTHLVLAALAHCINREQAAIIDYPRGENRVLRARLGSKRIFFTNAGRCGPAAKAKALVRRVLQDTGSIVTPETLLRWNRKLIARKYDGEFYRPIPSRISSNRHDACESKDLTISQVFDTNRLTATGKGGFPWALEASADSLHPTRAAGKTGLKLCALHRDKSG